MGPLVRGAVAALDGGLDPADTVLPVATLPGLPLPSPFPVPDLRQRLYFRRAASAFLPVRRPFTLENFLPVNMVCSAFGRILRQPPTLPERESVQFTGVTKGDAPSPVLPPFAADVAPVMQACHASLCDCKIFPRPGAP